VSKLIDTSTCIGCKACEVACQEWNDLPNAKTVQDGSYQTLPTMTANFWNLIKFHEVDVEGNFNWLMRKDQCMHCADPGCLKACPAPGAIVQYSNGIVDVNPICASAAGSARRAVRSTCRASRRRPGRCPSARSAWTGPPWASSRPA
jgi:Fe-S-cluster-containing dehydrogenase component